MSGEADLDTKFDEVMEARARGIGWIPEADYKGDKAKWVDAKTYVERGEIVLPILRKQNQTLHADVLAARTQIANLTAELKANSTALKTLQQTSEEDLKERVKVAREDLLSDIKQAKKDEDGDREVELIGQLSELDAAAKAPKKALDTAPLPIQQPVVDHIFTQWLSENPWMNTDEERGAIAVGIASTVRKANPSLIGTKAFYDEVDKRLGKYFNPVQQRGESKVEGGGGGGNVTQRGGNGKSYADLPAEAKAACDRLGRSVTGPERLHKDQAAWRASYVRQYFSDQE